MARRHSGEDVTEARRRVSLDEPTRRKVPEAGQSHRTHHRPSVPDDGDLGWQRREREAGWRQPHYEGFYDESGGRERAALAEDASAGACAREPRTSRQTRPLFEFWMICGPESGKGPKGYRRSDKRIRRDVNDRLTRHGQLDATEIEVSCKNGEVVLRGSVNNRNGKKIAEDCAKSVGGIQTVRNKLKLRTGRS